MGDGQDLFENDFHLNHGGELGENQPPQGRLPAQNLAKLATCRLTTDFSGIVFTEKKLHYLRNYYWLFLYDYRLRHVFIC